VVNTGIMVFRSEHSHASHGSRGQRIRLNRGVTGPNVREQAVMGLDLYSRNKTEDIALQYFTSQNVLHNVLLLD
jgi:hypothetical protein